MTDALWLIVALIGVVNCITFIVGYDYKTGGSWRYWPMGRHLMGFIVVLGVTFGLIAASRLIGPLGPIPWVTALAGLNVFIAQRNWMLFTRRWRSTGSDPSDETIRERR